jgi:hypothetical protein
MRSVRSRLRSIRRRLLALSAAIAALTLAAPVTGASAAVMRLGLPGAGTAFTPAAVPAGGVPLCAGSYAPSGVGDAGATNNQLCGVVLGFVGPSIGQVGGPIGATIIGSTVLAPVTVSSGPVAVGLVP